MTNKSGAWDIVLKKPLDYSIAKKLPNMHIHTKWCNHATNEIKSVVSYLKKHELKGYLNEHAPYVDNFFKTNSELLHKDLFYSFDQIVSDYTGRSMHMNDFQRFVDDYLLLKKEKSFLPIGFEVDYFKNSEDETKQLMFNISHILYSMGITVNHFSLSLHSVHGMSIYAKDAVKLLVKQYGAKQLILDYYKLIKFAIEEFDFDFVCHPGGIGMSLLIFGDVNIFDDKTIWEIYLDEYKSLIDLIVKKDLCLEINTSGFSKKCPGHEPNPFMPFEIFEYGVTKGVKFVIGSDFHHPEDSFRYFDQLYFILKENNAEVYQIVDRKKVKVELK